MAAETCIVCDVVLATDRASCHQCGGDFHFALRVDSPAQDCGDAWIDGDVQALVFVCNRCLGKLPEPAPARRRYTRRDGVGAKAVARARGSAGRQAPKERS